MLQFYSLVGLILLQAFVLFSGGVTPRRRLIFCVLCAIELACVIGLRSVNVGIDTLTYAERFSEISYIKYSALLSADTHFETGFLFLIKTLSLITDNPQILFVVSGTFLMWAVMNFIYKNTAKPWLAVLIYISGVGDFRWALTATRQIFAIAFILFAFEAVKKRKLPLFLGLMLGAIMFHKTAACFLIAYPLYRVKFDLKNVLLAVLGAALVFFNMESIVRLVTEGLQLYVGYAQSEGLSYLTDVLIKGVLLAFPAVVFTFGNKKPDKDINILLWFSLFALIFAVLLLKFYMLVRFELYFAVFAIVLIPRTFEAIKNKGIYLLCLSAFLICTFLYTQKNIEHSAKDLNFLPYEFYWQNPAGERKWNFTDGYAPW